jgi:hypothetical protein
MAEYTEIEDLLDDIDEEDVGREDEPRLFDANEVIGRLDDPERDQRIQDFDLDLNSKSAWEFIVPVISVADPGSGPFDSPGPG